MRFRIRGRWHACSVIAKMTFFWWVGMFLVACLVFYVVALHKPTPEQQAEWARQSQVQFRERSEKEAKVLSASFVYFRDALGNCYAGVLLGPNGASLHESFHGPTRIPCSRMPREAVSTGGK